jgi:hypothetical protein
MWVFGKQPNAALTPPSNLPVRHEWPSVVQASDASSYCTEVVAHATLSVLLVASIWHVSGVAAAMVARVRREIIMVPLDRRIQGVGKMRPSFANERSWVRVFSTF